MSGPRGTRRSIVSLLFAAATAVACSSSVSEPGVVMAGITAPDPVAQFLPLPEPVSDAAKVQALSERIVAAAARAETERGARVTVALLDRETGSRTVAGADEPIETASVVKLFIADDLLFGVGIGEIALGEGEYDEIAAMLSRSDDSAASDLWSRYGETDIVDRVVERHGLTATRAPADGNWWNTVTTASDLLTWYDRVLGGTSGLDERGTATIVGYLLEFESLGTDGYDQRFGLPDGLPDATGLGVKQGWMCCVDGSWIHLSTGFFGEDHRYVVAVLSREKVHYGDAAPNEWSPLPDTALVDVTGDTSAEHARGTLTLVVDEAFGRSAH
ncbi:serine hydrolase [Rhodococcus zopfii]|uniref:serine hydrolase n=1 Tax=Rhodococcus zopfii TaxID=43772 RepID=UPI0011113DF7|nr:serine hydrolase [Rhodococcus zopfii]